MSFFTELKRRNVFKVAAAYIIVGWLIMQAGEVMGPALRLPEWINSALAFFLILGFPLAMFFAWAFEMTPEGIRKEKDIDRSQSITSVTGQKLNHTIIGLMAVALVYFAWDKFAARPGDRVEKTAGATVSEQTGSDPLPVAEQANKKSIAVIPFQNRSANEENAEFFSDGVHDELLTYLSRIKELKVISRTSVMSYRDTTKNIQQIAGELGVANILEGGVQRAGDTVRINVQLIDATTDEHLWAAIYDRQLTAENIFSIQAEIANAIAAALEATLSPGEQEQLASVPTDDLAAYDNYLIARHLLNRGNWRDLREAQSYAKKAVEMDPGFVQAQVLHADTFASHFETGATRLDETRLPWENAIQNALSLDENNANALAALATFQWANNSESASATFEKAVQLEPGNADILTRYGSYLRRVSQPDKALVIFQKARELDPMSINVLFGIARAYQYIGELDKALEAYARIRQIDPSSVYGIGPSAGVYIIRGEMDQACYWVFKAMVVDPDDFELPTWIARTYIDFEDLDSARNWLSWTEQNYDIGPMTLASLARLNVYQGNLDSAAARAQDAFKNQMPDRWGAHAIMIRIFLIQALDQGKPGPALKIIRQAHPELFESPPRIAAANISQAIDTAHLMQMENRQDEARSLLNAAISVFDVPYAVTGTYHRQSYTLKAEALALLGEKQASITELRQQFESGSRLFWRWNTEMNPNFKSLREEPEFLDIVEYLRTDMARQLENIRAMEAAGEIPLPPEDDAK